MPPHQHKKKSSESYNAKNVSSEFRDTYLNLKLPDPSQDTPPADITFAQSVAHSLALLNTLPKDDLLRRRERAHQERFVL